MEPLIVSAIRNCDYRDAHDLLQTKLAGIWDISSDGESAFELAMRAGDDKTKNVFKTAAGNNVRAIFRDSAVDQLVTGSCSFLTSV